MLKAFNDVPEILGDPQMIKLTFECKEQIVHWENQLFHGDAEVSAAFAEQQCFCVLRVDVHSTKRLQSHRNRGTMRVFGSPMSNDHRVQQQQQQQQQEQQQPPMVLN